MLWKETYNYLHRRVIIKKPEEVNKYNFDLYKFMKADSTAVVLITNDLSELEKVMRFTHA